MSTRLPGAKYKRIFDRGRSVRGRLLVAWYLRSSDAGNQAGVVVSKKSFHNAVDRNRAKRLLREAFRLECPGFASDVDWILIGRSSLGDKRCGEVRDELRYLVRKAGCLAEK